MQHVKLILEDSQHNHYTKIDIFYQKHKKNHLIAIEVS